MSELRFLQSITNEPGNSVNPPPPGALPARLIANLRVVTDREALLGLLPIRGVVAELGVNKGDFSAWILSENQPARLHLIDPWCTIRFGEAELARVRERFCAELAAERVVIHRGFSYQVLNEFPDGYFDWVYIDTDHNYETTRAELAASLPKIAPGGILAGHDYSTGNLRKNLQYGVIAAVNEFCLREGWEVLYLTNEPSRCLSYALRELPRRERPPG